MGIYYNIHIYKLIRNNTKSCKRHNIHVENVCNIFCNGYYLNIYRYGIVIMLSLDTSVTNRIEKKKKKKRSEWRESASCAVSVSLSMMMAWRSRLTTLHVAMTASTRPLIIVDQIASL